MPQAKDLIGLRILVVEDATLIAEPISDELQSYGCEVVGPVGRLQAALDYARNEMLDGVILDVNLAGEQSFPVADVLQERGIPFVFTTGYDVQSTIPPRFHTIERVTKPFDLDELAGIVTRFVSAGR